MYSIVDIETTGNGIKGNRITEISIFKFDGEAIVDEFTSLVNPECEIPYFITGLTGIDNAMVRNAPKIGDIAAKIQAFTHDTIFVAHSVNFDYNVIKNELKDLEIPFSRKKLCTVRLSRKLLPGYHSYSLGKLCSAMGIPLTDRHRARGDAHATVLLFQKLLNADGAEPVFKKFLNARSQETTLPSSLPKKVYDALPSKPGIYFFKDVKGKIIYVGKAIHIKKRVLSHFYDKSTKEVELCSHTADIDFKCSGNEFVALLMESAAIKHYFPKYNRSQKRRVQQFALFSYEDRNGILHLAYNQLKFVPQPLVTFYNQADCRTYLERLCSAFSLCPKYCHLQENVSSCSHYSILRCEGICSGKEAVGHYNSKVQAAMAHIGATNENYIIKGKGRTLMEETIVLVKDGIYIGYGFVDKDMPIDSFADLEAFVELQKNTLETHKLIRSQLVKYPNSVTYLSANALAPI